jgi:FolB domain-containing protein
MRFHTLVGVLPHEGVHPQALEMDITVWLAPRQAAARERPDERQVGLDYRDLYAAVAGAVGTAPIAYLEDLVDAAASKAMDLPEVARVRVAARKPHVALAGPLDYAEVVCERERDA